MANGYKRCPNGHFYKDDLTSCPFCDTKFNAGANPQGATQQYVGGGGNNNPTVAQNLGMGDSNKTRVMPGNDNVGNGGTIPNSGAFTQESNRPPQAPPAPNRTVIIDDNDGQGTVRNSRKLVGWLVSYTLSDMGVDFKLFEGRNIIGRDLDCQISVNDPTVTSKHAVLLYRAGRYSITDQQSTDGTHVNGEDIELAPRYLEDGDIIRVGKTVFKFRSSL